MDDTSSLQFRRMLSKLGDNLVAIHMHNVTHRQISGNRDWAFSDATSAGTVTTPNSHWFLASAGPRTPRFLPARSNQVGCLKPWHESRTLRDHGALGFRGHGRGIKQRIRSLGRKVAIKGQTITVATSFSGRFVIPASDCESRSVDFYRAAKDTVNIKV
jgi:hypothetical protein